MEFSESELETLLVCVAEAARRVEERANDEQLLQHFDARANLMSYLAELQELRMKIKATIRGRLL